VSAGTATHGGGASAYDRFTGRWSRLYAPCLAAAAGISTGDVVLDVAAGTGEAAADLGSRVGPGGRIVAVDVSPAMLREAARKLAGVPALLAVMDGQELACRSAVFDAVVCQLGLMFFSDPSRGLEECGRVLRPGGRIAVQVWSRPDRVPYYGVLADALSPEYPEEAAALYLPSALADPDRLHAMLTRAGFRDVSVVAERRRVAFESFEEYWEPIEHGASRTGQFYVALPERRRRAVRERARLGLAPFRAGHRLVLEAEAFIGRGVKPGPGARGEGG
jgi:ubiquinone/menaquinone biosynthesis C-methylase UbiE